MRIGIDQYRSGDAVQALATLDIVAEALPNWYAYRPVYAEAVWAVRRSPEEAIAILDRCLELAPGNLECLRIRGIVHADQGARGAAISDLSAVVALRSGDIDTAERLARLQVADGDPESALGVLRTVAPLAPRRLSLQLLLARTLEATGRIGEARDGFLHVREIHRDMVQGATYLLRFLERHGYQREAASVEREIAREIERRQPDRRLRPL